MFCCNTARPGTNGCSKPGDRYQHRHPSTMPVGAIYVQFSGQTDPTHFSAARGKTCQLLTPACFSVPKAELLRRLGARRAMGHRTLSGAPVMYSTGMAPMAAGGKAVFTMAQTIMPVLEIAVTGTAPLSDFPQQILTRNTNYPNSAPSTAPSASGNARHKGENKWNTSS